MCIMGGLSLLVVLLESWWLLTSFFIIRKLCSAGAAPVSTFGKGFGPVHFSNFYCSGIENNLLNCTYYTYSQCSYHAGVKCEGNSDILLSGTLILLFNISQLLVHMVTFVYRVTASTMTLVELRFVLMVHGVLFVMTTGTILMPVWSVDN